MHKEGEEIHIDDTEASAGAKSGVMIWVLIIGTLLAIVALTLVWTTGALTQGEDEENISVGTEMLAEDKGNSTDSIVSENADEIDGAAATDTDDGAVQTIEN